MLGFIQNGGDSPPGLRVPSRRKKFAWAAALVGGVALAALVTQSISTQVQLTTRSIPPGIVNTSAFHAVESTVSVPVPPISSNGYRFSYWKLNGTRQQDAYGISVTAFSFKIFENSDAVAHYTLETADTDADGVADWYEFFNYGDLSQEPDSDTDGDGVSFRDEFVKGSQPRIQDSAADGGILVGGISRRRGEKLAVIVGSDWHFYSETSTPPGVVSRAEYLKAGTRVTTVNLNGEIHGHRFAQWTVNGIRQESPVGVALSQVNLVIEVDTSAVALYVPKAQDLDADQIPDWYEFNQYGTTDIGSDSDTDGDGRTFAEEYAVGTQPRIADSADDGSVLEGGISRRRGEKLALAFSEDYARYIETSQPPGVVSRDTYLTIGTSVSTPNAQQEIYGHKFAQWTLNGVRQASPAGIAISQVSFTLSEETTAIAYYYPATQDLDADQIPDWYEYQQYGTADFGPESDSDEDGVNFLTEYQGGTQPRIHDSAADGGILEGGISRRRGEKMVVNLQFFPAERRLLVENQLEEFFGDPYNQLTGGFGIGPAGGAAPALGDLDGDGDLDMIVAGADGTLRAFENRGSPLMASFVERATWAAGLEGLPAGPLYPAFGDWDRDGRADLAIGSNDGIIRFRKSNGFSAPPTAAGSLTAATGAVVPAFLPNVAGGLDLLVLKPDGLVARYTYTGNPLAPYAAPAASESILPDPIENGRALSVADANGDGLLDILASDADGRMWLFRSVSTGGYILNSKVWGGAYAGFANDLRAVVADLNGDGSPDILGGTGDGGLLHLRNPAKKLRIDPPLKTVLAGEGIPFRSIDNDGTLRWDFARNASGGTIDPLTGTYTAGPNAGIDGIIARSSKGLTGSAWVNVLNPSENEDIGRAIIVAGRRGPNDPVWPAARSLANRAYEVFRYRGYRTSDIAFLGHEPNDPGVGGAPTREAIQQALSNAAGAPSVVLYLVDHGRVAPGGDDGLFLLDKNEQFSGTELDGWLDTFQAANPETDVVVILECCYAQRLAEKLEAGNPPRRAVYASSSRNQVAVMVAGGSVSYSAMLWSELSRGRTFAEAHAAALLAMQRFQNPHAWDGNGLGNRGLGLGNVSEVARPSIAAVNEPQVLNGTAVANLWASGVDGSFQIERVWAVVVPPGYTPDGDAPVTDLPEIALLWNPSNQRYEVEYGGFTEGGPDNPYTLLVYARDIWGQVSLPVVTTVTQNGCLNRVVILAHGGQKSKGGMNKVHLVADFAHETTLLRRVEPENIQYLSEDGDNPRASGPASSEALRQAIVNWPLPEGKTLNALTLYLVGEADQTGILFENDDKVSHSQLAGWLDQLQSATGCIVHLIVDSDYSGRFLAACASTVHERIVIASCGPNERNPGASEWAGLSRWLWQAIAKGQDLRSGFGYASDLMSWLGEVPFLIDDDGDGVYNRSKDGFQALASFIGAAFITANDPPHIGLASQPIEAAQTETVNFWVANIVMPDGNPPAKVWAELIDPNGALEKTIELLWNKVYERYDGFASGFALSGRHVALVYAGDPLDPKSVSSPAPIQIFVDAAPPAIGTGGSSAGLQLPLSGQVFDASIEAGGAPFDTRLEAAPGQKITLEVFGVSAGRNVSLAILAPNGQEILRRDEWGNGFGERIWAWEPTAAGNYTVRISATASSGRTDFSVRGFLQQETVDVGSRLAQAIVFNAPEKWALADGGLTLKASATSGLLPEVELLEGPANLQDGELVFNERGQVRVRARQDGSGTYAPAPPVWRTIDVVLRTETYEQWADKNFGAESGSRGALDRDDDGDGISNRLEFLANTDPRDARSRFGIERGDKKPGGFEIRWQGRAGVEYRLLATTDFQTWTEVPNTRRIGKGQSETATDTDANGEKKFYRIEVLE